ncbi:DUF3054 domain-containing protein [Pseudactinotalea sp. HY158]|uniref:DUF3054 domain-containing protein n=1 Tax=Pseudactinotalea sp. HY158 TaxID=2654547 RepID=UPI00129CFB8B|nr:DUF3054 domain-containing protein [Pseudactinotalea sp. HY158]QGH70185.1 DUF3054 family protein [Pseudactinotalea sp. HY158]
MSAADRTGSPAEVRAGLAGWGAPLAFLFDALLVLAFVLAGRGTHSEDGGLAGAAGTAWPFWVALVFGWALARAWRRPVALWPAGVIVWATTVAGGLALRYLTGGGLAGGFPYVAAGVLAVSLLGWRLVALLAARLRLRRELR